MSLAGKQDLTRWNRAGLTQFRYIDGNAITFLETLRQKLVDEYDKGGSPTWQELVTRFPELTDETSRQTSKRLSAQYYDQRRDYAWEILRAFSRSAHVLGEYIDAYANEAYLPTAVEWDNVRKLVAMLGYRPSPPASADTHIALLFKEGESGQVNKGFAVKNKPASGESTILFETQEKLEGSDTLNQLNLKGYERSGAVFLIERNRTIRFPLETVPGDVSVGDVGVLASSARGIAVEVRAIGSSRLELKPLSAIRRRFRLGHHDTRLYLQSAFVAAPLPNGEYSARSTESTALAEGDIVFGKKGSERLLHKIEKNELDHLLFSMEKEKPVDGEQLYRGRAVRQQQYPGLPGTGDPYILPNDINRADITFVNASGSQITPTILSQVIEDSPGGEMIYYVKGSFGAQIYFPGNRIESTLAESAISELRFSGKNSSLESGSWVVVEQRGGVISADKIASVSQSEKWFTVGLKNNASNVSLLRAGFDLVLAPVAYKVNTGKAWSNSSTQAMTVLELDDGTIMDAFTLGQKLICATGEQSIVVELKDISVQSGTLRLHVTPAFHLDRSANSFTRSSTRLYGNVVRATHGETQAEKILGNGDASRTSQSFKLPTERISWVADPQFSSGVRADLSLRVGQRVWQQVEDMTVSSPEDHHYTAKINEDGTLEVCFGDGRRGRRLPTGADNVRVRYRTGYGEEGNLDADALVKIVQPHRLIESFAAPVKSSGGAEKETSESMRESAPATVLALERAVSLTDFTHLASHHSMVWQARAFEVVPNRPARPEIRVVIVPAGGEPFSAGSDLAKLIRSYLENHAVPNTPVSVVSFEQVHISLKLSIMVDENAFDRKTVELAVIEHIETELANRRRKLGQSLYRSEVIALMEEVEGVENGHCQILDAGYGAFPADRRPVCYKGSDGNTRRVGVQPQQLLYLDAAVFPLTIETRDYEI